MNSEYKHYFIHQISAAFFTRGYLITESKIWINWASEISLSASSSLVQVEEVEGNSRVIRFIFTISAASNTNHKRETANIKGHHFLRPDAKRSVEMHEILSFMGLFCKFMHSDAAFCVGTRLLAPRVDMSSSYVLLTLYHERVSKYYK